MVTESSQGEVGGRGGGGECKWRRIRGDGLGREGSGLGGGEGKGGGVVTRRSGSDRVEAR